MIIISIVRIIYVYRYVGEVDVTHYQAAAALFSTAELNVGVICTSMIGLNPFFRACQVFIPTFWATVKDCLRWNWSPSTDDGTKSLEIRGILDETDQRCQMAIDHDKESK